MADLWNFLNAQATLPKGQPVPAVQAVLQSLNLPVLPVGLPVPGAFLDTNVDLTAAALKALPFLGAGLELPLGVPPLPAPVRLALAANSLSLTISIGPIACDFPLPGLRKGIDAVSPAGEPIIAADPAGGDARLSARFVVQIVLTAGGRPTLDLFPDPAGDAAQIIPSKVLVGPTGFGLDIAKVKLMSASPIRGLAIEKATFVLPSWVPFVGAGRAEITDLVIDESGIHGPSTGQLQTHAGPSTITLRVRWDRPGHRSFLDAPPTLVEVSGEWDAAGLVLPGGSGGAVDTTPSGSGTKYRIVARWSAELNGPGMTFAASVEGPGGPDGLFTIEGGNLPAKTLATALGLGPGILGMATARTGDPKTASLAALLAASAALAQLAVTNGRVRISGLGVEETIRDGVTPPKITVDYTAEVGFDLSGGPLGQVKTAPNDPMRVRGRGVRLDLGSDAGPTGVAIGFDGAQIEVESPGSWQITGPAADLLRVSRMRSGGGSIWFEVDLAVATDLGIIRVEEATLRVTFDGNKPPVPEVRGLGVSINLPGLISGKGFARITSTGFDAGFNASLVPLNLGVAARLQLAGKLIALEIGVDFPGAIPFANSGLGLYGLAGQFALNARRSLTGTDPVVRELIWADDHKFIEGEQTSLGLAAVIGTVPDLGFSFSSRGSLIVLFPDPAVILTVSGKLLSQKMSIKDQYTPAPGLQFLGLVAVDSSGITFALRGNYDLTPLVKITVPLGAYFPFAGSGQPAYVRLGTDDHPKRPPGPVSVVVFPGIFDLQSWSFLMFEGGGIDSLGYKFGINPPLSLSGFAIGFGAGWEFHASAGPFSLSAGARVVVGIGTNPWFLVGVGQMWGDIDLGPVSLGVSAEVKLQLSAAVKRFEIEACASVSLLFIDIKGCVTITIGDETVPPIPDPLSPLKSIHLSDRKSRVLSREEAIPVGWPDALPILEFENWLETKLDAASPFAKLSGMATPDRGGWVGTDDLKYYFRLHDIRLIREDTGAEIAGPFAAVWATPRDTPAWKSGTTPAAGARELVLLDWYPAGWARNLLDGGSGDPNNNPANYPGDLCSPGREPVRGWAIGETAYRETSGRVVLPSGNPSSDPYQSVFQLDGPADGGDGLALEAAHLGALYFAGAATPFELPMAAGGRSFNGAYWLPTLTFSHRQPVLTTLAFVMTPSVPLFEPRVILAINTKSSTVLTDGFVPTVIARRDNGVEETWRGQKIAFLQGITFYEFRSTVGSGPWVRFTIMHSNFLPYPAIAFVGMEALSSTAKATADADKKNRDAEHTTQNSVATQPIGDQKPLLEPGVTYVVRVTIGWEAKRSARSGGKTRGPSLLPPQDFRFRIAGAGSFGEDPARLQTDESVFDARGLVRYIGSMNPTDGATFVFRNDPMLVNYAVGHAEALATKYGRTITLKIRRTDPPPDQTRHGFVDWIKLNHTLIRLQDLTVLPLVDQHWNDKVRHLADLVPPCRAPEVGATAQALVQLEPRAHYELRLMALNADPKNDPIEIRRTVFTTSNYKTPAEMLAALGFGSTQPASEILVTPTGAVPAVSDGDASQESALRALGLDPWPLAKGPQLCALWEAVAGKVLLRGVLIELDEPIHRVGRFLVTGLTIGGTPVSSLSRNNSGTRLLGLLATPIAPATGAIAMVYQDLMAVTLPGIPVGLPTIVVAPMTVPPRLQRDFA